MYQFEGNIKRKGIVQLQLAPMIDIFVLIIVFLLKGTILQESSIVLPEDLKLAQSISRESSQVAPEVIITKNRVQFKMVDKNLPLSDFSIDGVDPRSSIYAEFKKFLEENRDVEGVDHVNVISDSSISYKEIFNVVKTLRIAGFQSMLFVAESEGL
jgi:biopolymer transport protein ExbD